MTVPAEMKAPIYVYYQLTNFWQVRAAAQNTLRLCVSSPSAPRTLMLRFS